MNLFKPQLLLLVLLFLLLLLFFFFFLSLKALCHPCLYNSVNTLPLTFKDLLMSGPVVGGGVNVWGGVLEVGV